MVQPSSPCHRPRDLMSYEKSGPFTINAIVDSEAAADADAAVRKFMWDHWNQRRRGLVVATYFSREGQPKNNTIYIEPGSEGWEIVVESRFRAAPLESGQERDKMETHCASYDVVEREWDPEGSAERARIAGQALQDPHLYTLRLLNTRNNHEVMW